MQNSVRCPGRRIVPRMRRLLPRLAFLILLAAAPAAAQDTILLGTVANTGASGYQVDTSQFIAQPFTLSTGITLSGITLQTNGGQFDIQLTTSIGSAATADDVLLQFTFFSGTEQVSPIYLPPGTYYLVASNSQPFIGGGWTWATSVLPSQVGAVPNGLASNSPNIALPPASSFSALPVPLFFQLLGTADEVPPVPEPSSMMLPKVHPKLRVFDNDRAAGGFTFKLETISGKIRRVELRGRQASQRAQGTRGVTEYWSDEL